VAEPLLSCRNLTWHAGGRAILNNLTFAIDDGDFVGIIGPNGAGKTSLMRCLYRYYMPTGGELELLGVPLVNYSARQLAQTMAVVLQENIADFGLKARDVVMMGLIPYQNAFGQADMAQLQRIEEALALVEMSSRQEQNFHSLSGGEKQRILIARAIVQQPKILLLDEPANHLDIHFQIELLQLIKNLGITVLASFHDLNLAAAFSDKLMLIDNGELKKYDTPQNLLSEPLIEQVFKVKCTIDSNPFNASPRISYSYHQAAETEL